MKMLRESTGVRVPGRSARCGVVLLATVGLLVSACGSGDEQSAPGASESSGASETTAAEAAAQENAVVSGAVCYGWPNGTTDAQPCAVGTKGPGGGRVFYDAGSEQPWGRFLEVAPQDWGGTLRDCTRGENSCGAAGAVTKQTSDFLPPYGGYYPCRTANEALLLPGEAGDTLWEIGGGRRNTEVLLQAAGCVDGTTSALQLVTEYRVRSGLSDWHLPSGGELTELCKYEGRSAIGGFGAIEYLSSTVGPSEGRLYTEFYRIKFGSDSCTKTDTLRGAGGSTVIYVISAVRPIRAFSGLLAASYPNVSVGYGDSGPVLGAKN